MGNALAAPFDAEAAVTNAQTAADTAFMLMSAALVLLMTASLFYGGFVRDRNIPIPDDELRAHGNREWFDFGAIVCLAPGLPFIGGLQVGLEWRG